MKQKTRICAMLMALALIFNLLPQFTLPVRAEDSYSGSCGENLTWRFDPNTGTLTIEGSGKMKNYGRYDAPWYDYRDTITTVSLPDGLTSIGGYAFYGCSSLTSVTIPAGVTSIDDYAFGWYWEEEVWENMLRLDGFTIHGYTGTAAQTYAKENRFQFVDLGAANTIPDDAVMYNNHCYLVYNDTNSFETAQQKCVERGGHLATITTAAENSFVYNYIISRGVKSAYFGFTDAEKEGTWKWVTGETSTYTNWHSGEPNGENSREDYAMFYYKFTDGTWNDGDFGGSTVNGGTHYICEWDAGSTSSSQGMCLAELECVDEGHYTGNMGDARVYKLDATSFTGYHPLGYNNQTKRNGNVGIDGTVYENGFEVWIARWNFGDNNSWAYRTFKLDGQYHTLTGSSGIIKSYNTNNYDVTAYFYSGDDLLYSFQMTPSSNQFDFSIDVSGVDELKVLVQDNIKTSGGTSYALYNLFLDGSSSPAPKPKLSDEITHLIFADMAYAQIPDKFQNSHDGRHYTVDEWLDSGEYPGFAKDGKKDPMNAPMFSNSSMSRKDVYRMVGDWEIIGIHSGFFGYAAVAFQKGDDVILAFPGSADIEDWIVDAEFALFNHLNAFQFDKAYKTYLSYAERGTVTLTGHSLGGALVTYVSTLTGAKGYSYDGAAGHVINLTYLTQPETIPFHSKDQMRFTNYTDQAGVGPIADLIQHTNANMFPGIDYKTNSNYKFTYPAGVETHHVYSTTKPSSDGKTLEMTSVAAQFQPKDNWYMSVDFSKKESLSGAINGFLTLNPVNIVAGAISGGIKGRLLKIGNVHLGTASNDQISVIKNIHNLLDATAAVTANVIYGGDGTDELIGAAGPDVLVPGELKGDRLSGGLGDDTYILDFTNPGSVYISDSCGTDTVKLLGTKIIGFDRYDPVSNSYRFKCGTDRYVYIRQTILNHQFRVVNEQNVLIKIINTGLMQYVLNEAESSNPSSTNTLGDGDNPEEADVGSKEVCIAGACLVDVFAPDGSLAATYDTTQSGLYMEEFGTVNVTESDGAPFLDATIYERYTMKARGTETVDVCVVGVDSDNYVDRVSLAEAVALSEGEAQVDPEKHLITQGEENCVTEEERKTVSVSISKKKLSVLEGETAKLTASAAFADNTTSTNVYWVSSDPSVVRCEAGEDGACVLNAVGAGEAEVYAVAEDSGFRESCKIDVIQKHKFMDVPDDCFYAFPVSWACAKEITRGTSTTEFSPENECTRGHVVTFLWRAYGKTKPKATTNPFVDAVSTEYYYDPILWAVEKKITKGTDDTHFEPDSFCTRAQVVTFLWRAAGSPKPKSNKNPFVDVKKTADCYYYNAVLWAVEQGITKGTDDTHFSPDDTCTRGQVVTFLYRQLEND